MTLVATSRALSKAVAALDFGASAAFVYNPLDYARAPHEAYLERWGAGNKRAILLGMNPGPFGMAQTGVPFGDVAMVRDFLGIEAPVRRPAREHPKRPIEGFACKRSEVSGSRLWGFARDHFRVPEAFFETFFVVNYCPLVFMSESGANLTPDKLPRALTDPLFEACDDALRAIARELEVEWVVGVGAFARQQAERALGSAAKVRVGSVLHPSPASPAANRGWAAQAERQLADLGLLEKAL